jgi:hypothetical protein
MNSLALVVGANGIVVGRNLVRRGIPFRSVPIAATTPMTLGITSLATDELQAKSWHATIEELQRAAGRGQTGGSVED